MALNTPDELLRFARLDLSIVKTEELDNALDFASDFVTFLAPAEDNDRSTRVNPIRKRAELMLATGELFERLASYFHLTLPPKQTLDVLGGALGIGTDFPTPDIVQRAFEKTVDRYRRAGELWANRIKPVTATVSASKSWEEIEEDDG